VELWKESGQKIKDKLFRIIKDMYDTDKKLEDYVKSIIMKIINVKNSVT